MSNEVFGVDFASEPIVLAANILRFIVVVISAWIAGMCYGAFRRRDRNGWDVFSANAVPAFFFIALGGMLMPLINMTAGYPGHPGMVGYIPTLVGEILAYGYLRKMIFPPVNPRVDPLEKAMESVQRGLEDDPFLASVKRALVDESSHPTSQP